MDQYIPDRVRRLPPVRIHLIVRDNRTAQKDRGAIIRRAVNINSSNSKSRRLEIDFVA